MEPDGKAAASPIAGALRHLVRTFRRGTHAVPVQAIADPRKRLAKRLDERLATAMGLHLPSLKRFLRIDDAFSLPALWLLLYGALAIVALSANESWPPRGDRAPLVSLIVWNGLHFAVLIAVTCLATARVRDIVDGDILFFASDEYATAVDRELGNQPAILLFRVVPLGGGLIAVAAAGWAISSEFALFGGTPGRVPWDALFWAASSLVIYFAASRVVATNTFVRCFAVALGQGQTFLYPLDAASSPLVRGIARLNRAVLGYWAMVFLVIVMAMLLALPPAPLGLSGDSPFLFIFIPLAAFIALGTGGLVYLISEAEVGRALRRYTLQLAEPLQRRIEILLKDCGGEPERPGGVKAARGVAAETTDEIERLGQLHDRILAGGRYGSRTGATISLMLPFAMPAISLVEKLFS